MNEFTKVNKSNDKEGKKKYKQSINGFLLRLAIIITGAAIICGFLYDNLTVTIGCGFNYLVCSLWMMHNCKQEK
jgi:hypothetical protein